MTDRDNREKCDKNWHTRNTNQSQNKDTRFMGLCYDFLIIFFSYQNAAELLIQWHKGDHRENNHNNAITLKLIHNMVFNNTLR